MNILKDNKVRVIYFIVLSFVMFLSIGYSAFNVSLNIEDITAYVRVKKDIRITDFTISKTNNNAISEYEEYNYDKVSTLVNLPNSDSSITYRVELTNIETAEMGIYDITGLQDNLEYEVSEYTLKDRICDDSNKCNLGIVKDIYLTIKYKDNGYDEDNTKYDINLDFIFKEIFDITYSGIENNGYSEYIMEGEDLEITFKDFIPYNVVLYVDGVKLDYDKYSYEDGILRYNDVSGNTLIEYIEKVYLTTLSEGTYFKEDEHREKIKTIEFVDYVSVPSDNIATYDLSKNQDGTITGWIDKDYNLYVGSDWEIYGTDLSNAFNNMKSVEEITFNNLNTSETTNMRYMFKNTGYNVSTFEIIGINYWDMSNVSNIQEMFSHVGYSATTFNIGDLSNWNTSKVTDMSYMFEMTGYTASNFDVGNLDNWKTLNVTNMVKMFDRTGYSATAFNIGNIGSWDTSNVTNMYAMFQGAGYSATTFDIGNLNGWDVSNVIDMSYMFNRIGCNATTFNIGDLSNWDVSSVIAMKAMFQSIGRSATSFNIGNLGNWKMYNVTDVRYMFFDAGYSATTWYIGDLSEWDVSSVTNMSNMFEYAGGKNSIFDVGDLSKKRVTRSDGTTYTAWDTSNVTNMSSMFKNVYFKDGYTLDLSNWNVDKVTEHIDFDLGVTDKITSPVWVN